MGLELAVLIMACALALSTRPWRLLQGKDSLTPVLAALVLLPWMWALPRLHAMPLQLHASGACLLVLMMGWPLAVPVLVLVGLLAGLIAPAPWPDLLGQIVWHGVVPATLALGVGWAIRRWLGLQLFVYVLGRAFLGTAACLFVASLLQQWNGHDLPGVPEGLQLVARWLMAWGDAFITGMLTAVFVAFRPQWLATWSDRLYLRPPG